MCVGCVGPELTLFIVEQTPALILTLGLCWRQSSPCARGDVLVFSQKKLIALTEDIILCVRGRIRCGIRYQMEMPKGRDETKQNVELCRPFNLNFPMPRSFTTGHRLPMLEDKEKSVIIVQAVPQIGVNESKGLLHYLLLLNLWLQRKAGKKALRTTINFFSDITKLTSSYGNCMRLNHKSLFAHSLRSRDCGDDWQRRAESLLRWCWWWWWGG